MINNKKVSVFLAIAALLSSTAACSDSSTERADSHVSNHTIEQNNADKPSFSTQAVASFNEPWAMTALPHTANEPLKLLVTQKSGELFIIDTVTGIKTAVSGVPKVSYGGQGGLGDGAADGEAGMARAPGIAGVAGGFREGDAILPEVVGDADLAAKGVAAVLDADLRHFVVRGLQQDRHVQLRAVDQFGHRDLVAEVRQADHQPIDPVGIGAEMAGVEVGVGNALHGPVGRGLEGQGDSVDPKAGKLCQHVLARCLAGCGAEEGPAADNHA